MLSRIRVLVMKISVQTDGRREDKGRIFLLVIMDMCITSLSLVLPICKIGMIMSLFVQRC